MSSMTIVEAHCWSIFIYACDLRHYLGPLL